MICELLGVFVKILTYDDKYSLLNRDNVRQPIQMQLSQKQETFSELISPFFKARLNIEHFQKNMLPIADVFPKLRTPKKEVNQISKTSRFRELFPKQNVRWTKHCWNLNHTTFITFIAHCESNCVGKNISYWYAKTFLNILAGDDKYSLLNRDNLRQHIQMQLSQKQKTFFQFAFSFWKSTLRFKYFQQKDAPHSWCISEITDSEKRGSINV